MFCLRAPTDPAWAEEAVRELDGFLVDHAHCEMKAATNALSLIVRYPGDLSLAQALTELAGEELEHFARVIRFLEKRGLELGAPPVDEYAGELRRAMSALPLSELGHLADRLLVGALIEARSCERFKLLIDALPEEAPSDLRAFYQELFAAEARHYRTYVDLAVRAAGSASASPGSPGTHDVREAVEARLAQLAEAEAAIVVARASASARATVHG